MAAIDCSRLELYVFFSSVLEITAVIAYLLHWEGKQAVIPTHEGK